MTFFCVFFFFYARRGVRNAARPAWASGGRDAGVPLPSPLLPVGSRPKGGHAGGRCPHPGEAGRQEDPPRLPANDYQAGQRHHRHQQLERMDRRVKGRGWETCTDTVYRNISDIQKRYTHVKESTRQTPKHTVSTFWRAAIELIYEITQIHLKLFGFFFMDCPSHNPKPHIRRHF